MEEDGSQERVPQRPFKVCGALCKKGLPFQPVQTSKRPVLLGREARADHGYVGPDALKNEKLEQQQTSSGTWMSTKIKSTPGNISNDTPSETETDVFQATSSLSIGGFEDMPEVPDERMRLDNIELQLAAYSLTSKGLPRALDEDSHSCTSGEASGSGASAAEPVAASSSVGWTASRQRNHSTSSEPEERVPVIGGCVSLQEDAHSAWLLPPEVLLHAPSNEEIIHASKGAAGQVSAGARNIFLNTPLMQNEIEALQQLHLAMPNPDSPKYFSMNCLRMLHQCKFDIPKTVSMAQNVFEKRAANLPVSEAEVLPDLRSGFMYWHGRDLQCRPCLVIRLERLADIVKSPDRAMRLVTFVLEYALRYVLVPGRVECWGVVLDLQNALKVVSIFQVASLAATAQTLSDALEKVYCCRLAWMKIVNMPLCGMLSGLVNAAIPAEKKHKVNVASDATSLRDHFALNQLEECYGGNAPNLSPEETYPFHFFPDATLQKLLPRSQHTCAPCHLHLGDVWDTAAERMKEWLPRAEMASLPPAAALALSKLTRPVRPCCDMDHWMQLMKASENCEQHEGEGSLPLRLLSLPLRLPSLTAIVAAVRISRPWRSLAPGV